MAKALQVDGADGMIFSTVDEALDAVSPDMLVDFTSAEAVKGNVVVAIEHGVCVVNGTSGLTTADYAMIADLARLPEDS